MARFTEGELEVMQVLWEHGELKPGEVQERFPRDIRNAAVRSVLLVLLEKGHVARRKVGKAYFYKAKTPRGRSLKAMTRRLADTFCGGSSAALIMNLLESEELSDEDIQELHRLTSMRAGEGAVGPEGEER